MRYIEIFAKNKNGKITAIAGAGSTVGIESDNSILEIEYLNHLNLKLLEFESRESDCKIIISVDLRYDKYDERDFKKEFKYNNISEAKAKIESIFNWVNSIR